MGAFKGNERIWLPKTNGKLIPQLESHSGAGHEKGVYMTNCEAVWHGLENWKENDNNSKEVLFIKQMLREATWMDCTQRHAPYSGVWESNVQCRQNSLKAI